MLRDQFHRIKLARQIYTSFCPPIPKAVFLLHQYAYLVPLEPIFLLIWISHMRNAQVPAIEAKANAALAAMAGK